MHWLNWLYYKHVNTNKYFIFYFTKYTETQYTLDTAHSEECSKDVVQETSKHRYSNICLFGAAQINPYTYLTLSERLFIYSCILINVLNERLFRTYLLSKSQISPTCLLQQFSKKENNVLRKRYSNFSISKWVYSQTKSTNPKDQ